MLHDPEVRVHSFHISTDINVAANFKKYFSFPSLFYLIFPSSTPESEDLTSARQYYMSTRDAEGTLEKFPRGRPLEVALLKGLVGRQGPNDYLGALKRVSSDS